VKHLKIIGAAQRTTTAGEIPLCPQRKPGRLYLPNISFGASYSLSDGSRTIDLPLGDLLNPVYKSLNQLTSSTAFPKLQNQSVFKSGQLL
jgi:hypothetical protein